MGGRRGVPASRYGSALMVMEEMGWTYAEYLAQPWDLIAEAETRLNKRALAEKRLAERNKRKTHGIAGRS